MPVELRLLSWNVHGTPRTPERPQRLDRIAAEVLDRNPDVVRPGGLLACVRRLGPWRVLESSFRQYRMAAPRWRVWEGDGIGRKGIQRLDLAADGHRAVVLNTHLQASYPRNGHANVRGRQLLELRSIASTVDGRAAVLAAGDLNTRPEDAEYRHITAAWVDLTAAARARDAAGTCLNGDGSDAGWLDYVLARPHPAWQVTAAAAERIVNVRPDHPYSDHHGLDVTVRLVRTGAGRPWSPVEDADRPRP